MFYGIGAYVTALLWLSVPMWASVAAGGVAAALLALVAGYPCLRVRGPYFGLTTLVAGHHAKTSWLGVGLSTASLLVMPVLGIAKRRLGVRLGSTATAGEGTQNLLCAYLAGAVLVGLLTNTLLGWWWLHPVVAVGIAGLAVWEGVEAWRGEDCC